MADRSVAVELKAQFAQYISAARQAGRETKQTAAEMLALSKVETQLSAAIDGATASAKKNGQTLDQSTAKGRANKAALDQIARATREYRQELIAQGASQEAVAAATDRGRTAWLAAASAMGMQEAQAKKMSGTLFAGSRIIRDHSAEVQQLAFGLGVMGAAAVLGVGKAVKSYAEFDRQMSAVSAQGADAKANLDDLRAAAIKYGADTQYSATEAAAGITELLKAGVKATDVLNGGLAGALDLAASGQMSVADAAGAMSTALSQFQLPGTKASHVADLLAAGAASAKGEVSDMVMALAQGGLVAHQTGLSVEETTAALTMFAKAGLLGSDSGTSLKTMLQRLNPQTAEAKAKFKELGISAYDAQGNFVGLENYAGQLHQGLKDLSPEARNAALQVMFGSDAVRAASVLYEQGAAGVAQYTDAVNQQGFAQRQARELTNNLTGDIERLGGSMDTVFIQSGSGANATLRQMAQGANVAVDAIGKLSPELLSAVVAIAGSGGLAVLGIAGFAKLSTSIQEANAALTLMGAKTRAAKLAVAGFGTALAVGTIALTMWAQAQAEAQMNTADLAATLVVLDGKVTRTDATIEALNQKLTADKVWGFGAGMETAATRAEQLGISVKDLTGYISGTGDEYERVKAILDQHDSVWSTLFPPGDQAAQNQVYQAKALRGELDGLKGSLTEAERSALQKAQADEAAGKGAATYSEALIKGADAAKGYSQALLDSASAVLKASGSQIGWEAALDDTTKAIKKNGEAHRLANGQLDLNTAKGRANQEQLNQLAASSVAYAQSLIESQAPQEKVEQALDRSRKQFIAAATAAGMTKTAAEQLADAYGLIPSDLETNIKVTGGDKSAAKLALVQDAIKDLPPEQQLEIRTAFDNGGIKAADEALNKINGKHVSTYVDVVTRLQDKGIGYIPPGKTHSADGDLFMAVSGMLMRQFADGGFGQPQVRPFQGSAGVNWGEQGSGPWEAFISGAPQKRDRSIAIWKDVGRRLLGSMSASDVLAQFADGGIAEPTWGGKNLSYWQEQLRTPLEITQLRIQIRDLKAELRKKGKKRIKGLDRTEAEQRLSEAEADLDVALKARAANADKLGTIADRLASYTAAKEKQDAAAAAAKEAQDAAAAEAAAVAQQAASASSNLQTGWRSTSSVADLIASMNEGAARIAQFQNLTSQLQSAGLSSDMVAWLGEQGVGATNLAKEILAGGQSAIDQLNAANGSLTKAADQAGQSQATGQWGASTLPMPGYLQAGAGGSVITKNYNVTIPVTASDPYAVAVAVDQSMRNL